MYFDNIFKSLELTNEMEQEKMKESGFFIYERQEEDTKKSVLQILEKHFCL